MVSFDPGTENGKTLVVFSLSSASATATPSRVAAIDKNGKRYVRRGSYSFEESIKDEYSPRAWKAAYIYKYDDIRLDDIDRFELQLRPRQRTLFKNVSLRKNKKTDLVVQIADKKSIEQFGTPVAEIRNKRLQVEKDIQEVKD